MILTVSVRESSTGHGSVAKWFPSLRLSIAFGFEICPVVADLSAHYRLQHHFITSIHINNFFYYFNHYMVHGDFRAQNWS